MVAVVIPVKNEGESIWDTLKNCIGLNADYIIPVINGCIDNSKEIILSHPNKNNIKLLEFSEALGIDVPRAAGAALAYKLGCQVVLFLDGDMKGEITHHLLKLIQAVRFDSIDMALTNCYPYISNRPYLAHTVLRYRERLNKKLGLFNQLGLANPSHGPHAVSRRLLESVPWSALAVPPLSLAMASIDKLNIQVGTAVAHNLLQSSARNDYHSLHIAETIIGDCLTALNYLEGKPLSREENGIYYLGYHPERRFDVLEEYVKSLGLKDKAVTSDL
ncbi:MAG: glycosyltransferase family 2 protein [Bacillota bacterium]